MTRYLIHRISGRQGYPVDRTSLRIGIFMKSEGLDRTSLSMRTLIARFSQTSGASRHPLASAGSSPTTKSNSRNSAPRLIKVSRHLYLVPQRYILSVRRFRQGPDSRVTAPWPAAAGSYGLHASEGQCYHCPVSTRSLLKNQAFPSIPVFYAFSRCFPAQYSRLAIAVERSNRSFRRSFPGNTHTWQPPARPQLLTKPP